MSGPLNFRLRTAPGQSVDVSALRPAALKGLALRDIAAMTLPGEREDVAVGDLFDVRGEDSDHLVFEGDCGPLCRLGAELEGGTLTVEGSAGDYLACGMRAGSIEVRGNAADFAGAEMHAGTLRILGNCGDFAGGVLPGSMQGMRGGVLHIQGNAGVRAADRMRRGLLLIEGDCGDFLGARMLAGTVVAQGQVGASPGFGLRRGTLVLFREPLEIPMYFNDCGRHQLGFLSIMQRALLEERHAMPPLPLDMRRWCGDLAEGGHGEILHP